MFRFKRLYSAGVVTRVCRIGPRFNYHLSISGQRELKFPHNIFKASKINSDVCPLGGVFLKTIMSTRVGKQISRENGRLAFKILSPKKQNIAIDCFYMHVTTYQTPKNFNLRRRAIATSNGFSS
jgi:hypothetical protein